MRLQALRRCRDQIHCCDVVSALWEFAQKPRPGEVYNLGGGKANSASLAECVDLIASITGKRPTLSYMNANRIGDHICYYSDLRKFQNHYPSWRLTKTLPQIVEEIAAFVAVDR